MNTNAEITWNTEHLRSGDIVLDTFEFAETADHTALIGQSPQHPELWLLSVDCRNIGLFDHPDAAKDVAALYFSSL